MTIRVFAFTILVTACVFLAYGCASPSAADGVVHYGYQGSRPAKCTSCE